MRRRQKSKLPFFIVMSAGVVVWAGLHYYRHHHAERLGAGTPLDQSHSQIKVLSPSNDTPTSLPTATSSTAIIGEPHGAKATETKSDPTPLILTSSTVITTPVVTPPAPSADAQNLKLGITLTLLADQYGSGGSAALATLASATKLATATGNAALADKLESLHKTTPANGPITAALLLVEAQRINALGSPNNNDDEAEMPTDWLHNLIKVRSVEPKPEVQTSWQGAMQSVLLQLAANNPAGASTLLNAQPLQTDDRLSDLRTALASYLDQSASLNAALAAYVADTP